MPPSPRLRIIKEIAERIGLSELADIEAHLVRYRDPPPRLVAAIILEEAAVDPESPLSARERQVMVLLSSGFSRAEIGAELGIGYETVKSTLTNTYRKLGVSNQIQAVNAFMDRAA